MTALLTVNQVSLRVPLVEKDILQRIQYHVQAGDFIIVLGGNGSGKSSLLKLIDRRYTPTSGSLSFRDQLIQEIPLVAYYRSVKTLTQSSSESLFMSLTVLENYHLFSAANKTKQATSHVANYLADYNAQLATKLHQPVSCLSGGEKQALLLALIMVNPPDLLLLDEHTAALDPASADNIMRLTQQMVTKYRVTCLLTTHDLAIAANFGNRLLALKEGKLYRTLESVEKARCTASELRTLCY